MDDATLYRHCIDAVYTAYMPIYASSGERIKGQAHENRHKLESEIRKGNAMSLKTRAPIIGLMLAFAIGSANAEENSVPNSDLSQAPIATLGKITAKPMAATELAQIQGKNHIFTLVVSTHGFPISQGMNWSFEGAVLNLMNTAGKNSH